MYRAAGRQPGDAVKVQPHQAPAPDAELAQLQRAVKLAPRSARAHADLGLALQRAGQFAPAVASQRRALDLDPGQAYLPGTENLEDPDEVVVDEWFNRLINPENCLPPASES